MFQEVGSGGSSSELTVEYFKNGTNTSTNYATLSKGKYLAICSSGEGGTPSAQNIRTTPTLKSGNATITKMKGPIITTISTLNAYLGIHEIEVTSETAEIYNPIYGNMAIIK